MNRKDAAPRLLLVVLSLITIMSSSAIADDKEASKEKYWSTYFPSEKLGDVSQAARVVIDSNIVLSGTIRITSKPSPDDPKKEVKGMIEGIQLLYGSSGDTPAELPFKRLTSTNAFAFIESKPYAPFSGWYDHQMDGVPVVVFIKDRNGERWNILKVVPIEGDGGKSSSPILIFCKMSGFGKTIRRQQQQLLIPNAILSQMQ